MVRRPKRYTLAMLHEDLDRYHINRLFVIGILGCIEIPMEVLPLLLKDALGHPAHETPDAICPYRLTIPHVGVGLLHRNEGGKKSRNGIKGWVATTGAARFRGRKSSGTARAHALYCGRTPLDSRPLTERIQSVRSRIAAARAVYDQGLKDGRRDVIDQYEDIRKTTNYLSPGRPKR